MKGEFAMSMLRIKSSNAEFRTFPRFLQDYANYLTGIEAKSEKTVCEYLLDLRTFFRYIIMVETMADISVEELEKFDVKLGELLEVLREDDLLILTADHGNDPTHTGTDHTREKVPFIAYSPSMRGNGRLEDTDTFAVIGATIADNFGVEMPEGTIGSSVCEKLV